MKFLAGFMAAFLIISIPFLRSLEDLIYYIKGTVLVHSSRSIQGRPILSFITYYTQNYGISTLQEVYPGIFSKAAFLLATVVPMYLLIKRKITDKYTLTTMAFLIYYLLTPVLSRTHLIWILPFMFISLQEVLPENRQNLYFATLLGGIYIFLATYHMLWVNGLRPPDNTHNKVWIDHDPNESKVFPGKLRMRNKYYEYRGKLQNLF